MKEQAAYDSFSSTDIDSSSSDLTQYLSFRVGEEDFGVALTSIMEIKAWVKPTRLPNGPDFLMGVVNVRGIILPIFDLKARFGVGNTEVNAKKVIVFIKFDSKIIGILVDGVSDIIAVNDDEIKPPPKIENEIKDEFISGLVGVESKMIILLDIEKLFYDVELNLANIDGK